MSLIKKADVKNHLSTRHRTEIHLYRPEDEPKAASVVDEKSADTAVDNSASVKDPLDPPTPGTLETASFRPGLAVVSTESRSAKE